MEDKIDRLEFIKKIIMTHKIDCQEKLLKILEKNGIFITQATLSRDLKYLRVVKAAAGSKGYYYAFIEKQPDKITQESLVSDFMRGFVSINFSGAFGLIKTLPGYAQSLAYILDSLKITEILGTIAGDDTILLIPRDGVKKDDLLGSLENKIPGLL